MSTRGRELAKHLRTCGMPIDGKALANALAELLDPTPEPMLVLGKSAEEWAELPLTVEERVCIDEVFAHPGRPVADMRIHDHERLFEIHAAALARKEQA